MFPVIGREVVESKQRVSILAQAIGGLLVFQRVALDEGVERQFGSNLGFGHPDLLQRSFGFRLLAFRQLGEHVRGLVHPAALLARFRPDLTGRLPEPECAIGDYELRGLNVPPQLVIADGALGFWKAAGEVWPKTRGQRCWVHKTANVLTKLPKSQHARAKRALEEIWMADTKKDALVAFDAFVGRMPDQRSRSFARLLRLPSRALEASAHVEPRREHIRD